MHMLATPKPDIIYPDSDGQPMADNTKQLRWIVLLYDNLSAMFADREDVFVAANLLWYPVEKRPQIKAAPDVMVAFGRPKGDRGSYCQWEEDDIAPQVTFEILSPGNTIHDAIDSHTFYEEHGVEEYYLYDPETNRLDAYRRNGTALLRQRTEALESPRLGVRFDLSGDAMTVYRLDGSRFLTYPELEAARKQDRNRSVRLAELSRKVRRQLASAEELAELERLENELSGP